MKFLLTLLALAAAALAAPVAQSSYATYGKIELGAFSNWLFQNIADAWLGDYGNTPKPGSYSGYGSYPPPAGGYGNYGSYKREGLEDAE